MGKILVVDDDAMTRKMAEMVLKKTNHEIILAESGAMAIETLEAIAVDLLLMDIEMPSMNGIECLEQVRQMNAGLELPVIFMTGTIDARAMEAKERLKAIDCIEKPFRPQDMLDIVSQVL